MSAPTHHWPLNDTDSTARDIIGGVNGTIGATVTKNQPSLLPGNLGSMLFTAQSTDKITLNSAITPQLGMSVAAVIKPTTVAANNYVIVGLKDGTKTFSLRQFGGGLILALHDGVALYRTASPGTEFSANDTVHVVATVSLGGSLKLYINGAVSGVTLPGTLQADGNTIGNANGGGIPFNGYISDVKVWLQELSEDEVEADYAAALLTKLTPDVVKQGMVGSDGKLKPSLVNASYQGYVADPSELKPGLVSDGKLKPSLTNPDGTLKPGLLK